MQFLRNLQLTLTLYGINDAFLESILPTFYEELFYESVCSAFLYLQLGFVILLFFGKRRSYEQLFCQKPTNTTCKHVKAAQTTFAQKKLLSVYL